MIKDACKIDIVSLKYFVHLTIFKMHKLIGS